MNREHRTQLAAETVAILERGEYRSNSGETVRIAEMLRDSIAGSILYRPEDHDELRASAEISTGSGTNPTTIEVTNETTLAAARCIVEKHGSRHTLCLNFASAKNPGGGFLRGSQAQEESLARSSGLYASLSSQPVYYDANRRCGTALYTDHMILSPAVPVFRDDDGDLLATVYCVGMLTAPAVNARAVCHNEPNKAAWIAPTMAARIEKLLRIAMDNNYRHLVLGAWGCGVFGNKRESVAAFFAETLTDPKLFAGVFHCVTFAILDDTPGRLTIGLFREHMKRDSESCSDRGSSG